jgi:hypothetical protein
MSSLMHGRLGEIWLMSLPWKVFASACFLLAGSAPAQEAVVRRPDASAGPVVVSCDVLPGDAVREVPPPFDQYAQLVCTRSGQALRPVSGFAWVFPQGPMWLASTSSGRPTDHFTKLQIHPMTEVEKAALLSDLGRIADPKALAGRDILRMDVEISSGEAKQEYLLLPPPGAAPDVHVLGMECIHNCKPIDKDPWFFVVQPTQ